jgi:acetyl esterase
MNSTDSIRPTLIFDGECAFCLRWVERLGRWTPDSAVRFLPLQEEEAPRLAGRTRAQLLEAMHLVTATGEVFAGAAAAREVLVHARWGMVPRMAFRLPGAMFVADRVYRWVAARRQNIGCGGEHCRIPVAPPPKRD